MTDTVHVSSVDFNFSVVLVDFEMIKELILNQTVTANMVLLVTGGLPFSGKSTLINKLVNASGR